MHRFVLLAFWACVVCQDNSVGDLSQFCFFNLYSFGLRAVAEGVGIAISGFGIVHFGDEFRVVVGGVHSF